MSAAASIRGSAHAAVIRPEFTRPNFEGQGQEKRQFVHGLFTTIAPRYDWFNRLASLGLDVHWRRIAVRRGGVAPGMRVLDVCTGTGDFALLCATRQRGQGVVAGADFTHAMLTAARRKQQAKRLSVGWVEADALTLPFAAGGFDRVLIGFSTRNLSNLADGLRELLRVLKPDGTLIVLETGSPSHPAIAAGYRIFLGSVVRVIGLLLTGRMWPFTYLAKSVKGFLRPAEFVALMETLGASAEYVPLSGGLASLYLIRKSTA